MNGLIWIYEAALHTPWWVYVLLVYLIIKGVKASKTRVVPLKKMAILPILFVGLSVYSLVAEVHFNLPNLLAYLVALCVGAGLGYWQVSRYTLEVDRDKHLIKVPGTWETLILIIIIFAAKYYFGYRLGVNPGLSQHLGFSIFMLVVYGVTAGLFVGRFLCYLRAMKTAGPIDYD